MKKNKLYLGETKNRFYTTLLWITGLVCVITSILVGSFVYTTMSFNKYSTVLNNLSEEMDQLKDRANQMIEQEEEYKRELERFSQELAKYQPIIIPESMK